MKNRNKLMSIAILIAILLVSCTPKSEKKTEYVGDEKVEQLLLNLHDAQSKQIMVVAHRADWRNAPENSLAAIESAIRLGVDIVEIDVHETKDGQLVLMHDATIDRTTSGKGYVKDWTLDSLKMLNLRDGCQTITAHKIPTLEEALRICKGKVLVNLDKSYPIIDKCYAVALKTGTAEQIIVKGSKSYDQLAAEFGEYIDKVIYMPIRKLSKPNPEQFVDAFIAGMHPVAFEFTASSDTIAYLNEIENLKQRGARVWINSLWPQHCANHDDERAFYDPSVYDWFITRGVNIIQTDRPQLLLEYLRSKGLHD